MFIRWSRDFLWRFATLCALTLAAVGDTYTCELTGRKWTANLSQVVHNKKTPELYGKDGKLAEVFLTTDGSAEKLAGLLPIYYMCVSGWSRRSAWNNTDGHFVRINRYCGGITILALVDSLLSTLIERQYLTCRSVNQSVLRLKLMMQYFKMSASVTPRL
ncbi:hypothetical protein AcW1_006919 [Taiwanofungus camphoratus]|nr:hypothetical protein AcW1_006919 [Antrodia cinnamomea]